jgi:hypothetical protein
MYDKIVMSSKTAGNISHHKAVMCSLLKHELINVSLSFPSKDIRYLVSYTAILILSIV